MGKNHNPKDALAELLTPRGAANILGIRDADIKQMLDSGVLPCVHVHDGIIRIHPSDLAAFIQKNKKRGTVKDVFHAPVTEKSFREALVRNSDSKVLHMRTAKKGGDQ